MKIREISALERQVMEIVWEKDVCCVKDVYTELVQHRPIAYTTILTVFQRLYEKGLLSKKVTGKAYVYIPKISRERYTKNIAGAFLKEFIASFGNIAIVSVAESIGELPAGEKLFFLEHVHSSRKRRERRFHPAFAFASALGITLLSFTLLTPVNATQKTKQTASYVLADIIPHANAAVCSSDNHPSVCAGAEMASYSKTPVDKP